MFKFRFFKIFGNDRCSLEVSCPGCSFLQRLKTELKHWPRFSNDKNVVWRSSKILLRRRL
ncbi:hypothetical protein LEP1GSC090_0796 [Leptospira borgpetersenii serovar Javanica str. MK146]|nr:hypothetical protein LEP1GSC090_0796 [Leptospira borgpetersenii serovar Javanica str. MK146]